MNTYSWIQTVKKTTQLALQMAMIVVAISGPAKAQSENGEPASSSLLDIDPEFRPVVTSVLEYTVAGLESAELAANLTRFGLTDETVAEVISTRLQESFASGVQDLGRDMAISYATDVVAETFADIMLDSVYAEKLPDKLKNPLRAMLEATVKEGFGVAESIIVDSGTVGPFALVFPVIDRVHDVVEIHDAASGAVQARNAALMSAALGAEINAKLLSEYPSAQSNRVAYQWLEETNETLRSISSSDEYQVLASTLEDGFNALIAVQANACDSECEAAIERLRTYQSDGSNALDLDPLAPIETSLRVLGGYDPTESLAHAMLELTSLRASAESERYTESHESTFADAMTPRLSVTDEEPLEEKVQRDRKQQICDRYRSGTEVVTGARMVSEVRGLTGYHREQSIRCMRPQQSFVISVSDLLQLVHGFGENNRKSFLCSFRENLPTPQTAYTISVLLGDLSGYHRESAIRCLHSKLKGVSLSTASALQILGSLVPEQFEGWDETLANYSPGHHLGALCQLSEYLTRDLSAEEAALLLGQSRNYTRKRAVTCIRDAIAHGLTWEEVETILGPSISHRGDMIDTLGERTPDGLNARKLREFMDRYRNDRYLNDPDPPAWLRGQCIEFAQLARVEVAGSRIAAQFGSARNVLAKSASAGLVTETDPQKARVGALVVWDEGKYGHVGVVIDIRRNSKTGLADRITIAESNWGVATNTVTKVWGLSVEEARRELVSDWYGYFDMVTLRTNSLDRPPPKAKEPLSYKFIGYVLP